MAEQVKISVHSLADLKNTSDDAIPNYLNSLKFKQDHTLSDVKLGLGYTAFVISAACFYWDYTFGFDNTKWFTAAAVAVYTFLNGILTFWIWGVEKNRVYVGTSPSGDKVEIASSTRKHIPIYNLSITYFLKSSPKIPNTIQINRPFTQWFDAAGHFIPLPFQQMFAGEVPVIGRADPLKAITASGKATQVVPGQDADREASLQQTLAAIMASGTNYPESVMDSAAKKTGKGKKKA